MSGVVMEVNLQHCSSASLVHIQLDEAIVTNFLLFRTFLSFLVYLTTFFQLHMIYNEWEKDSDMEGRGHGQFYWQLSQYGE
jgi:hypothetical protein